MYLADDTITFPATFDKTVRYFYGLAPSLCKCYAKMAALRMVIRVFVRLVYVDDMLGLPAVYVVLLFCYGMYSCLGYKNAKHGTSKMVSHSSPICHSPFKNMKQKYNCPILLQYFIVQVRTNKERNMID